MFRPSISHRVLAFASLAAIATASVPAEAQQITRIVAFGDSYTDTGNAFALGYANPQALAIYPTRRFSSGTNYIDTLASILRVPVEDFAIGGAFGGSNNGTLCFDPFYAPGTSPLCGKGLQYEIDQFFNVGTQSAVFPNASTTLTRSDLIAISIGGNDARFYQQAGGTLAGAPTAGAAAGTATTLQLDRLVAAGNPTISFLALNGAVAPEVAANPSAQAIRGAYSTAYFTAVQPALARYAAGGSIVHYLEGQLLLNNVAANPTAYGITNGLVCPIFPDPTCLVNANGYLFYGDALHLTSQGYAIVARYVAAQLAAPLTLQAPSDLGLDTARQWGRTLSTRADLYRGSDAEGLRFFAVGDSFSRNAEISDENSEFEIRGAGATVGAEYGLGSGLIGIAGNYSRPKVNFGNETARIRGRSWQIGAYGSLDFANAFAQAYLGYGRDRPGIDRAGVVENMSARPTANHTTAGAKAGYLFGLGGMKVGPVAALDYAHAKVGGYTESGDLALTLNVGSQSVNALTGQAGIEARGEIAGLKPYVDLTVEHDFSGDDRLISFAQTSAPTIVNTWAATRDKQTYGRVAGGASFTVLGGISIDAAATSTIGRDGGQEFGGQLGVKAHF
jgi:outer membrane lipase/esterase